MNRRGFLKWVGITPAAPVAVAAASKFEEVAKRLDVGPAPKLPTKDMEFSRREMNCMDDCTAYSTTVLCYSSCGYIRPER